MVILKIGVIFTMDLKLYTMKKGTFTSEWDNGVFTTPAELDEVTGEITTESIDVQGCV